MKILLSASLILLLLFVGCKSNTSDQKDSPKREIASIDEPQQDLINSINKSIVSMRKKEDLNTVINYVVRKAQQDTKQEMPILQLYASILRPLKLTEGIVWRLRGILEQSHSLHLMAINALRKVYYRSYLVGPHVRAWLDYLTKPNLKVKGFNTVSEVQEFLRKEVLPELTASYRMIQHITKMPEEKLSFTFDGHIVTGFDEQQNIRYLTESKRYRTVLKSHIHFVVSNYESSIATLHFLTSYNFDKALKVVNKLQKKTFFNNLLKRLPVDLTTEDYVKVFKKYPEFLTAKHNNQRMDINMRNAMNYFLKSLRNRHMGWKTSIDDTDPEMADEYIVNPNLLAIKRANTERMFKQRIRLFEEGLQNWDNPSYRGTTIISHVTGREMVVNLKAFYKPHRDMKNYFPVQYSGGKSGDYLRDESGKKVRHPLTNKKVYAWNYSFGRPLTWADPTFGGFIPEANNDNLYEVLRTLRTTWATQPFARMLPIP